MESDVDAKVGLLKQKYSEISIINKNISTILATTDEDFIDISHPKDESGQAYSITAYNFSANSEKERIVVVHSIYENPDQEKNFNNTRIIYTQGKHRQEYNFKNGKSTSKIIDPTKEEVSNYETINKLLGIYIQNTPKKNI